MTIIFKSSFFLLLINYSLSFSWSSSHAHSAAHSTKRTSRRAAAGSVAGERGEYPLYALQEISYNDLLVQEMSASHYAAHALITTGALQITNIPNFKEAREEALKSFASCLKEEENTREYVMADSSIRRSVAGSSSKGIRGPMDNRCGESATKLRAAVDSAIYQLFAALDSIAEEVSGSERLSFIMEPYYTLENLVRNGEHLEHMHAYYGSQGSDNSGADTLALHTDGGMFIAMTAGYLSSTDAEMDNGKLYAKMPTGNIVQLSFSEDSLVVLIGEAGANWIHPSFGSFRAIPHSLKLSLSSADEKITRSWYGKMYLPPNDAYIVKGITYQTYRENELQYMRHSVSMTQVPIACSDEFSYTRVMAEEDCSSTEIYCWMTCQSVSSIPCGRDAYCGDPTTGQAVDPDSMCTECIPLCGPDHNSTDFCVGIGTTMYMDGFTTRAGKDKGSTACVNLLFKTWTLDNEVKFAFSCIGVLLLGLTVQFFAKLRADLFELTQTLSKEGKEIRHYQVLQFLLFGGSTTLSYFLMLVAMTYSVELFSMVIVGLTLGYAAFLMKKTSVPNTDPCCAEEGIEEKLIKS